MMLRKRSRTVGSKQDLMADSQSLPSPTETKQCKSSATSLLPSPRVLAGMSPKSFSDHEASISPSSPINTKHLWNSIAMACSEVNPMMKIAGTASMAETKHCKPISLGILDVLSDENTVKQSSEQNGRKVLFASQLKIQVPLISPKSGASVAPLDFPSSPIEFGIKNKDSQLAMFSPAQRTLPSELPAFSPRVVPASIPVSEMEHSEDYTRVISHGPNPRTTHIFDNCVVESCVDGFTASVVDDEFEAISNYFSPNDSLSFCNECKKNIEEPKDVDIFRFA